MADLHQSPSEGSLLPPSERGAPVVSAKQIEIAADPEAVWEVLAAFDRWPSSISSTIRQIEPPRRIGWTGRTLGMKAFDAFQLQPHEGRTVVREQESWNGLVAHLFRRSLQKTLDRSLDSGLQHLKAEVERQQTAR
jgi:hypothetical protein